MLTQTNGSIVGLINERRTRSAILCKRIAR